MHGSCLSLKLDLRHSECPFETSSSAVQSILDSPSAQWHLPPNPPPSVPLALAPRRARRSGSGAGFGPNKRWRSISQLWVTRFHKTCIYIETNEFMLVPKNWLCIHVFLFSFYWWLLEKRHAKNLVFLLLLFDSAGFVRFDTVRRSEPGKVWRDLNVSKFKHWTHKCVQPVGYRVPECWNAFLLAPYESFL